MDYSLPGSSVHGLLQARMLEWVAIPFSGESSQPRDQTPVSCIKADSSLSEPPEKCVMQSTEFPVSYTSLIMKTHQSLTSQYDK